MERPFGEGVTVGGNMVIVGVVDGVAVGSGVEVAVGRLVAVSVAVGCATNELQEVVRLKTVKMIIR